MEGLGKKLQEARLARKLTLDEAARMTKIRPSRLQEIESGRFLEFSSLAYAKGFLLIYGKFLERRCHAVSRGVRNFRAT